MFIALTLPIEGYQFVKGRILRRIIVCEFYRARPAGIALQPLFAERFWRGFKQAGLGCQNVRKPRFNLFRGRCEQLLCALARERLRAAPSRNPPCARSSARTVSCAEPWSGWEGPKIDSLPMAQRAVMDVASCMGLLLFMGPLNHVPKRCASLLAYDLIASR